MTMKTLLTILLLTATICRAQITNIDLATATATNVVTSSGLISFTGLTIPGICTNASVTNASYFTLRTNTTYGDPLITAFGKANANFAWQMASITNEFRRALAAFAATNATLFSNTFFTSYVSIGAADIPSNTWSWYSVTNGHAKGSLFQVNSNGVAVWTFFNSSTGLVTVGHSP